MGPDRSLQSRLSVATRRSYLHRLGALGAAIVTAGVGSEQLQTFERWRTDRARTDPEGRSLTATEAEFERSYRPLDVVHRWSEPSEVVAVETLLDGFDDLQPSIESLRTAQSDGSGAGVADSTRQRIVSGNPPSTFQCWGGPALDPFVDAVSLHAIDDLWTEEMHETMRSDAKQATDRNGSQVAVPVSIHRVNTVFFNVELVERAGIDPYSLDEPTDLLDAIDAVETETDATGLVRSDSEWAALHLFEQILLGASGLEAYGAVVKGDGGVVQEELEGAVSVFTAFQRRTHRIAARWDETCRRLLSGTAAFLLQGDWAVGQFRDAGFDAGETWDGVPFPGTAEMPVLTVDCFVFPVNNPSPDATTEFLTYLGTPDAQRRFNGSRGSLPARTDVPVADFGPFQRWSERTLEAADVRIPSIAFGMAIGPNRRRRLEAALSGVSHDDDISSAVRAVTTAITS